MTDHLITNEILKEIGKKLRCEADKFTGIGVSNGLCGLSLFHLAYSKYNGDSTLHTQGIDFLYTAIERLNSGYKNPSVYREMAEIGHFIQFYSSAGLIDLELDDLLADFDAILYQEAIKQVEKKNFDPNTGAFAFARYFMERPAGVYRNRLVSEILDLLKSTAIRETEGCYWHSKLNNSDAIYLGLSHGSSAVINFLTAIISYENDESVKELIDLASKYIVSKELKELPVYFPTIVGENTSDKSLYANNWCYGDPGTVYGLYQAALNLQDCQLMDYCINLLQSISIRKLEGPYLNTGYGLIYGKSGLAMIYHKLYEQSNKGFLQQAYNGLIKDILTDFDPDDKFLGYGGYWNQHLPYTNLSFAEGLAGIGISLMAYQELSFHKLYRPFLYLN